MVDQVNNPGINNNPIPANGNPVQHQNQPHFNFGLGVVPIVSPDSAGVGIQRPPLRDVTNHLPPFLPRDDQMDGPGHFNLQPRRRRANADADLLLHLLG